MAAGAAVATAAAAAAAAAAGAPQLVVQAGEQHGQELAGVAGSVACELGGARRQRGPEAARIDRARRAVLQLGEHRAQRRGERAGARAGGVDDVGAQRVVGDEALQDGAHEAVVPAVGDTTRWRDGGHLGGRTRRVQELQI